MTSLTTRTLRLALPLLAAASLPIAGCGGDDDDEVPIDQIQPDKAVIDLSDAEQRGLCSWATEIAKSEFPPPGTEIYCGGITIRLQPLGCTNPTSPSCTATVEGWRGCFPTFIARLGDDPCLILDLQVPGALSEFLEETPGCEGMGPCGTTMQ
ncbi:MAG: hypothetical protein M3020_20410 [Myxococcota bacterium]|jgi:hypothetical protein|nr:hypothetical protein [Myxococcota bacterium]